MPVIYKALIVLLLLCLNTHILYAIDFSGILIYSQGNTIFSMNLQSFKKKSIYVSEKGRLSHKTCISFKDNDTIYFSYEGNFVSLKISENRIKKIDKGILPMYIKKHNTIIYYKQSIDGKLGIYKNNLSNKKAEPIIQFDSKINNNKIFFSYLKPVVQISNNEIVFVGKNMNLCSYDIKNNRLYEFSIQNCIPVLYLSESKNIICADITRNTGVFRLLSLDKMVFIKGYSSVYTPIVYLPEYNSILYNKTEAKFSFENFVFREIYPLYLFSFNNNKEEKLLDNEYIDFARLVEQD